MAIRITRNDAGNCINFVGSTNPAYWNACLSAVLNADDVERFDVINDIRSANDPDTQYEFYAVHYSDYADKDGNVFTSAQEAVDYINNNANVTGVSEVGTDLTGIDLNFKLDQTSTSIILDNGSHFGVNTVKAVADVDGTIHLHAIGAGLPNGSEAADDHKHFEKIEHTRVSVNGVAVAGGLQDVANTLNELFTVGAFESVVISDPYSTMIADVAGVTSGYTLEGADAVDPEGDDIFTYDGSGYNNYAGLKSTATIDQAGEYFTFDIRGEGPIGFGLVHTDASYAASKFQGNSNYANPDNFAAVHSAHYGMQFSHWFHPTPNGSWTNYGALTGYVGGPGWSNWDQRQDWLDGNPVKIRCGLDENGYIAISSLQDDGSWVLHSRSNYPSVDGAEYHLGIKSQSTAARVRTAPKVHLLTPEAPTMYFRYIESPDGTFHYPLFATAEEAEYYDEIHNALSEGTGSSHTHVYVDDPTGASWYMPEASHDPSSYSFSVAPSGGTFDGNAINWTEITSLTNSDLAPSAFTVPDYTFAEGATVAIQVSPQDAGYNTTVSGLPSELSLNGGYAIQGTTRHVYGDQVHTITVTRTNSYGSVQSNFDLTVTDDAAQNAISGLTIYGQNPVTQSPDVVHHYSGAVNLDVDLTLDAGTEIVWTQQNDSPDGGPGQYLQIGIASTGVDKATNQLGNTTANWDLKTTIWTNSLNHMHATGWTDNAILSTGSNHNVEWKISFPTDGGVVELYRDSVLVRTSAGNYTGSQTLTIGVPVAYTTTTRLPSFTRVNTTFTGSPPAGFTQEYGSMSSSTVLGTNSVVTLDQVLPSGKRLVVNKSWIETNVLPYCDDTSEKAYIGVPKTTAAWGSVDLHTDFDAVARWEGQSTASHKSTLADGSDAVARHESNVGSATNAYYHFAIEWDGVNLVVLADTDINKFSNEHDYTQFTRYSAYENYTAQSGDLPLVMATKSPGTMALSMSGISLVDIPAAPASNQTSWTKALDFSGSSERAQMVVGSSAYNPMMMDGRGDVTGAPTTAGDTSNDINARPWATAIVFKYDGNSSNQHVWNVGEGAGSTDDNIYLRLDASGWLYFGWGRSGAVNECKFLFLGTSTNTNHWHGIYIAHDGTRLSGANATVANLAAAFDIRWMSSNFDTFTSLSANYSTSANWTAGSTGGRMDRTLLGNLTIGGRGANRNFHGKVASFVTTTLRRGVALPGDAEIERMISDPVAWLNDDKIGNPYRIAWDNYNNASFALNDTGSLASTQVWLMGDGNSDSYSNMIRNVVSETDQNYTKLNLISMVSNDIQNVTINGLT